MQLEKPVTLTGRATPLIAITKRVIIMGKAKSLPSQERLNYLFSYSPDTGVVTRKTSVGSRGVSGDAVGCKQKNDYLMVRIDGFGFYLHRIVWALHYGSINQELQVDHINGIRSDNRISNLRVVSNQDNGKNQKLRSTNASGVTGVGWDKREGRWRASIHLNGKHIYLGHHKSIIDAVANRKRAEKEYGYHENHGKIL